MATKQGKVGAAKSEIVAELPLACSDETAAVEFFERKRWGECPACPCCGDIDVYKMKDRATGERSKRFLWRCRGCQKMYSVRTGTVYEESLIPMRHWAYGFWAACASKKGVSAKQIQRHTGLSYKSALFLLHRIRYAMTPDPATPPKMTGTIEVDETFVGGKPRPRAMGSKADTSRAKWSTKTPVVAMVERGGNVRAQVVQSVTARNVRELVLANVDRSANLMTDEANVYIQLGRLFASHGTVHHKRREYVRGDATTNTIESFFGLVKRGMYGTYHAVSKQHLHRYVDEFAFRWNHRKVEDGARTLAAIRGAEGKRLMYREPVKRAG